MPTIRLFDFRLFAIRPATLFLALATAVLMALPARAAEPTAESVDELLRVTKAEAMVDAMVGQLETAMRAGMQQAVAGQRLSDRQQGVLDAAPREFAQVLREELAWAKIRPIYIGIYRESFTQAEIDGMLAFYNSPVGQAFVAKMPAVLQRSSQLMQVLAAPMAEKMRGAMERAIAQARSPG